MKKKSNKRHNTKPLCKLKDSKLQMKLSKHLVKSLSPEINHQHFPTGTIHLEGLVKWLPFQEDVKTNIQFVSWVRPSAVKSSHIKRTEGLVPN